MGWTGSDAFADEVSAGHVSLEAALHWHLRANHFPPVPAVWVPVAMAAIEHANEGDYDASLERPQDKQLVSVGDVVEGLHLDSFIDYEEDI